MTDAAIILAAGASTRMGRTKALLPLGGRSAVRRIVTAFRDAGVDRLVTVVPPRATQLARALRQLRVPGVVNPDPTRGMFSSVRVGVDALPGDVRAFFVHPVDIPLVTPATIARLSAAFAPDDLVLHPCFDTRRGHPPLLSAALVPAIRAFSGEGGLRALLSEYEDRSRDLPCDDPHILTDLDTPEDYRKALRDA